MKNFTHIDFDLGYDLTTKNNGYRVYETPTGEKYPSITSILSILSKKSIEEWKKRIGHEKANKISRQASNRGTKVHELTEKYINNDPEYNLGYFPDVISSFKKIKPELNKIDNILLQEAALYSDELKIAGRVDCIADYDGKLSIIDFKTSRKPKKREWIDSYFMQAAFYGKAFHERTGIKINQSVIIIAVDGFEPQVFTDEVDKWIPKLIEVKKQWAEEYV